MAEVIWTEAALSDLDAIVDYIAIENPAAAARLVRRVFQHVVQLEAHHGSGRKPQELRGSRYRQIDEPPCSVLYRFDGERVLILHVMRSKRLLKPGRLIGRDRETREDGRDSAESSRTVPAAPAWRLARARARGFNRTGSRQRADWEAFVSALQR